MGEEEKLIGKKEIEAIFTDKKRKFNISILEEGIRQAELRLKSLSFRRDILEKRLFNLFYFFISLITVLISFNKLNIFKGSELFSFDAFKNSEIYSPLLGDFLIAIFIVVISLIVIFLVSKLLLLNRLESFRYGVLGRRPNTWLKEGIIEGDDNTKGRILAITLYNYRERIETSEKGNKNITRSIYYALITLLFTPSLYSIWNLIVFLINL